MKCVDIIVVLLSNEELQATTPTAYKQNGQLLTITYSGCITRYICGRADDAGNNSAGELPCLFSLLLGQVNSYVVRCPRHEVFGLKYAMK
jgi:hypothetical protein